MTVAEAGSPGDGLRTFVAGFAHTMEAHAHQARILAEKHDGWLVVAERADRVAAACRRILLDLAIVEDTSSIDAVLVGVVFEPMFTAWDGGYLLSGQRGVRELYAIARSVMEKYKGRHARCTATYDHDRGEPCRNCASLEAQDRHAGRG